MPTEFRLRFPLSEVAFWAARYAYADDAGVEAIGEEARQRGWYTRDEFLAVMRWKSVRTLRRCAMNTEAAVVKATQSALYVHDQSARVRALTALQGVGLPSASILLHFAHRDPYPILDERALWSLGVDPPPTSYSFDLWWQYARTCRALADEAGVSMRTLDRALWQYSKEHQPPRDEDQPPTARPARKGPIRPSGAPPAGAKVNKSAAMRDLFEQGRTVSEVAAALGVAYGFAYGVRQRWQKPKA